MMRNLYEYDGLHRITAMNNVLFGPTPFPDAFSNTYSYDKAGNIQQLMRRGIIDMGPGNVPQSDTIDLLDYTYADIDGVSSVLASVDDGASNPLAQPLGVAAPINTYGYDGNGNMTVGGPVNAQYNIMNLPTQLTTSAGERHFAYVYAGGKYSARIEADSALTETRLYLGGMEFKDGEPENYNFGDGRIVYSDTVPPRPQFRLHDHLGNTVVFFEDKDNNGCITTEADTSGLALEILQRLWYYPFGMAMEGLSTWDTAPGQWYRYNGKERDTLSGWTDFGARWGVLEIGRWNGVDPVADQYAAISPYACVANNPILLIDPDGRHIDIGYVDDQGNQQYYRYGSGTEITNDFVQTVVNTLNKTVADGLDVEGIITTLANDDSATLINETTWDDHNNSLPYKGGGIVNWSPEGGIVTDNGDNRSPAVGLLHELGHIYYDVYNPDNLQGEPDYNDYPVGAEGNAAFKRAFDAYEEGQKTASGKYDNPSDKWVIERVENPASLKLGQPTRNSHSYQRKYRAVDPFSTKEKSNE